MSGDLNIQLPPLHAKQQEIWDSKATRKVICCGRRFGKTHIGVLKCIAVALTGGTAWWIAPTYKVSNIGWRLLRAMVMQIPGIEMSISERRVEFPNGGVVQVMSAENPDSLRGDALDFVCFEEAADIKVEAWEQAVLPALAEREGEAWFIGTPKGQDNWFYDLFVAAEFDEDWERWQIPSEANPFNPGLHRQIAKDRKTMPPIIFAQEYMAEFVVGGGVIFMDEWQRWYTMIGDQHTYMPDTTLVLGHEDHIYEAVTLDRCIRFTTVDLAISLKTSADFTVIAAWAMTPQRRLCLLDFTRKRMESPEIEKALMAMRSRWRLSYHGIEKVAFQASIIQQMRRKGVPVRELKPDKDKMARALTAAAHMEGGRIWWRKTIHGYQDFVQEVMTFPLAKHDDCTDTVSYAAATIDSVVTGPQLVSW